MIKVYAPHGVFEFDADGFTTNEADRLWINKNGDSIAVFASGEWSHAQDTAEEVVDVEAEGVPRVWHSLSDVPVNVAVEDEKGDIWRNFDGKWKFDDGSGYYGPNDLSQWDDEAPFTEVVA